MVAGLAAGADDFMVKPIRVLNSRRACVPCCGARIRASTEVELHFGPYHFFPQSRTLQVDGQTVDSKHREYELALFLFQNLGRLLSREHLREAVWGRGPEEPSRSLDTHISRLRTKLSFVRSTASCSRRCTTLGYSPRNSRSRVPVGGLARRRKRRRCSMTVRGLVARNRPAPALLDEHCFCAGRDSLPTAPERVPTMKPASSFGWRMGRS